MDLVVHRDQDGWRARFGEQTFSCAVGRGGVAGRKTEGDGTTPAGCWPLRRVLFRADRLDAPPGALPTRALTTHDGWCDDPADPNYNRPVTLPYPARHERLWRDDRIYDVIAVMGYNDDPPRPGAGSAIFLHVARAGFEPTEGCVALALADLLRVLGEASPESRVCVEGRP
jgi:L,D-peptidoglycan transpeptidase YkuD (ErfK/YbiS/YcfS/YnhG family)